MSKAAPEPADILTRISGRLKRDTRLLVRGVKSAVRQIHLQSNHDWKNSIFLAGSGRGGTTWVAEIINHANEYRFIFEPFYAWRVPACSMFRNRQYIRTDDPAPEFLAAATTVLTGRFHNDWTDLYNHRLYSDMRLIKDIRANLFLHWLHHRFSGVPIVLLMRHPCAVISSRLSLKWDDDLSDFLSQPDLMRDHLEPFRRRLENPRDAFERHLLRWCVENWIPLRQFKKGEIHLAFYEEFCERPRAAVEGLFGYLRKPVDETIFGKLAKPSSQTRRKKSAVMLGERPADGWRKHVTPDTIRQATETLRWFGLDAIYGEASMPNIEQANALLGRI